MKRNHRRWIWAGLAVLALLFLAIGIASYEPCKSKKKNTPWELAHEDVLFFLDLYGDSRT